MVSKINIGPKDGPYVAINEENGNLQLEDNSGNVVAEWDETNAQWDFANNTLANVDALNSNSVSTDKLNNKPATVTWGDSGEYVVLGTSTFGMINASTTSSTYTDLTGVGQIATLSFIDQYLSSNLTTHIGWDIYELDDSADSSGDAVYARLSDRGKLLDGVPELELTTDDAIYRVPSDLYEISLEDLQYGDDPVNSFNIQGKAEGDAECTVSGVPQIYVLGEVA